jgi:hypothetical protein
MTEEEALVCPQDSMKPSTVGRSLFAEDRSLGSYSVMLMVLFVLMAAMLST